LAVGGNAGGARIVVADDDGLLGTVNGLDLVLADPMALDVSRAYPPKVADKISKSIVAKGLELHELRGRDVVIFPEILRK